MPNFGALLKMAQYAPMVFEFFKAIMPAAEPAPHRNDEALEELAHFQRNVESRIADMEEEIARLRARVREAESLAMTLQVWLYIGLPAVFLVAILAIIR
ncbi:MAG: hypothetical protein ACYC6A_04485 [Armatimonadota bacterium]